MISTDKPKRYFSESAIAKALGKSQHFLIQLARQGILTPLVVESAHSQSRAYPAEEILALAVSRRMRGRRLPLNMIVSVCNFLRSKTIDELEVEWADGRKYLLSVNRCPPLPVLLSHEAIFENPAIDLKAAAAAGVDVILIDVAEAYRELTSLIARNFAKREAEHRQRVDESPFARGRRRARNRATREAT